MSRKKTAKMPSESESTTSTATIEPDAVDDKPVRTAPIARPAWIDGPPVTVDGKVIREGSPQPTPQMQMPSQPETSQRQEPATPAEQQGKSWGDPYKSIFSCKEQGFELGEHRQFKQRVFRFNIKPTDDIIAELKEIGFTYRGAEKSWTIPASPDNRKLTDELARKWAGPNYVAGDRALRLWHQRMTGPQR